MLDAVRQELQEAIKESEDALAWIGVAQQYKAHRRLITAAQVMLGYTDGKRSAVDRVESFKQFIALWELRMVSKDDGFGSGYAGTTEQCAQNVIDQMKKAGIDVPE